MPSVRCVVGMRATHPANNSNHSNRRIDNVTVTTTKPYVSCRKKTLNLSPLGANQVVGIFWGTSCSFCTLVERLFHRRMDGSGTRRILTSWHHRLPLSQGRAHTQVESMLFVAGLGLHGGPLVYLCLSLSQVTIDSWLMKARAATLLVRPTACAIAVEASQ